MHFGWSVWNRFDDILVVILSKHHQGINVMGFYADTMHMARLWDTARDKISGEEIYIYIFTDMFFLEICLKVYVSTREYVKNILYVYVYIFIYAYGTVVRHCQG
jgi:hypothetical protein